MLKKEEKEYEEYERLKNSKFKQQKLPGWRPVPSMIRTTIIFFSLGIIFAGLGVLILLFSNETAENIYRYDEECKNQTNCTFSFKIKNEMKKNIIFIYYQLDKFYQNHRKYIESRSDKQLNGAIISEEEDLKDCEPFITNEDMGFNGISPINQNKLDNKSVAIPCGIMAKNYFTDYFTNWKLIKKNNNKEINLTINESNIARKSDIGKYKNVYENLTHQWLNMTDEHFIVWMRPSPFPNFTKLWGRIITDYDFEKDDIVNLTIMNKYNITDFNGSKYLVLKTVNNFGGNNTLLAISYMFFGGICLILGIVFIIGFKAHTKKEK